MSSLTLNKIRVLSIDPGYERMGVSIIESGQKEQVIFSDCVITDKKNNHEDRINQLGESLERLIKEYQPTDLAIEKLFFTNNQKTALKVSEVRGLCIYIAKNAGLNIFEYTPNQIKVAVTGNGRATKKDIIKMIPRLVKIEKEKALDDEYDAIACGLTHLASVRFPQN